jgi:large subunit ribosomal protein L17e
MVKYSAEPDSAKSAKARGSNLRVHFKHTREVAHAIKGMKLTRAKAYLENVLEHKEIIPFTVFMGGAGRHAQSKNVAGSHGAQGRWPAKATRVILDLLKNAEANADMKGLDADTLFVTHAQSNRAPKQRRRTYRAHGRIGPYMSNPAHIELVLSEKDDNVAKGEEDSAAPKLTRKQQARSRITSGGGAE